MGKVPNVGDHGHITADCLRDSGVTVTAVTDSAIEFRLDSDHGENTFPVGRAAFESGRFVEMDNDG